MNKKNTIDFLNILFGIVSLFGNAYLIHLFTRTDYLEKNPDNTLIAPLITFVLGTGLKSFYAYAVNIVCREPDETNRETHNMKHTFDFITAFTFFAYVSQVLTGKEVTSLILIIGCAVILAFLLMNANIINRIRKRRRIRKRINKKHSK